MVQCALLYTTHTRFMSTITKLWLGHIWGSWPKIYLSLSLCLSIIYIKIRKKKTSIKSIISANQNSILAKNGVTQGHIQQCSECLPPPRSRSNQYTWHHLWSIKTNVDRQLLPVTLYRHSSNFLKRIELTIFQYFLKKKKKTILREFIATWRGIL